jgi:hypothetical protein
MRSAELRSSPFLSPQNSLLHSSAALHSAQTGYFPIFGTSGSPFAPPPPTSTAKESAPPVPTSSGKETAVPAAASTPPHSTAKPESSSNVVSSTMEDDDKTTIKVLVTNVFNMFFRVVDPDQHIPFFQCCGSGMILSRILQ